MHVFCPPFQSDEQNNYNIVDRIRSFCLTSWWILRAVRPVTVSNAYMFNNWLEGSIKSINYTVIILVQFCWVISRWVLYCTAYPRSYINELLCLGGEGRGGQVRICLPLVMI